MNRREFIRVAATAAPTLGLGVRAMSLKAPQEQGRDAGWRTYEVATRVRVLRPAGETRIWLPQPLVERNEFQRVISSAIHCDEGRISSFQDQRSGLKILKATFPTGSVPEITTIARVATRDWSVDLSDAQISSTHQARPVGADTASFLKPTRFVPTDGIVKETADVITAGAQSDVEKARAVYDWIVRSTYRNPKVRGCGVGDIRPMLEMNDLGGKCADINALFVGLMKASGVPARDVYGIRVGPTALECSSLGTSSHDITKAQHCRAEVYLTGFGWVPMDPADVRKVMLEEPPGKLTLSESKVVTVQRRLFGSWEMNWIAYNYAQDVTLPGSSGPSLHFLMYPQAETEQGRLDCLDPETFQYGITSREL